MLTFLDTSSRTWFLYGRKTRNWRDVNGTLLFKTFLPHSHRQFINWLCAFCITILLTLGVALLRIGRVGACVCTLAGIRARWHASPMLLEPFDSSDSYFSLTLSCFLSFRPGLFIIVAGMWLCSLANRLTCGSFKLVWIRAGQCRTIFVKCCLTPQTPAFLNINLS